MTPNKQTRIVHLFLSKLELLTKDEREVLIDAIALINNPRYIAADSINKEDLCSVVVGSAVRRG